MLIKMIYTLIYDASCPFCDWMAHYLQKDYDIKIIPNTAKNIPYLGRETVKKDVHLIIECTGLSHQVYSGAHAAIMILELRYPFLKKVYETPVMRQIINLLYFAIKKIRKHI